ncbi:hypothetical protein GCM10022408_29750 [Hymenobacter fastidiosus]|uniref:Helix-turn-helix domain-containing protein n=2 Tax=Hymenobacter fastidiosus TaxID=486264 RepID=A0ABP7SQ04_9BACT
MTNPFDFLNHRLETIEELLKRLLLQRSPDATPTLGGMELAQQVTRLSKARLYNLVSARAIPHSKRGNKLYFDRSELLEWVAAGKRSENKTVTSA